MANFQPSGMGHVYDRDCRVDRDRRGPCEVGMSAVRRAYVRLVLRCLTHLAPSAVAAIFSEGHVAGMQAVRDEMRDDLLNVQRAIGAQRSRDYLRGYAAGTADARRAVTPAPPPPREITLTWTVPAPRRPS